MRVCVSVWLFFFFFDSSLHGAPLNAAPVVLIRDIHIHETATHHQQSSAGQIPSSALCSI